MTKKKIARICSIEGCLKASYCKQLCAAHYHKMQRHGDPLTPDPRRHNAIVNRERDFWANVNIKGDDECWEWLRARDTKAGYGFYKKDGKMHKAHRWAYFYSTGKMPELLVLHSCDNPPCCNPNHLREGTHQDNHQDMIIRHRKPRGESSGMSKLTEKDIKAMRKLAKEGQTYVALSKVYLVDANTISSAVTRKTWKHVT